MKLKKNLQIAFLIIGALTAIEFIFVQGMFSWIIMVVAVSAIGLANIVVNVMHKDWMQVMMFALSTVALCMGYFAIV